MMSEFHSGYRFLASFATLSPVVLQHDVSGLGDRDRRKSMLLLFLWVAPAPLISCCLYIGLEFEEGEDQMEAG